MRLSLALDRVCVHPNVEPRYAEGLAACAQQARTFEQNFDEAVADFEDNLPWFDDFREKFDAVKTEASEYTDLDDLLAFITDAKTGEITDVKAFRELITEIYKRIEAAKINHADLCTDITAACDEAPPDVADIVARLCNTVETAGDS